MLTETLALLEPLPPGPEHVAVLTEISGAHHRLFKCETGIEFADRALALAAELGLSRPARALGYRATNRHKLGDAGAGEDFQEAAELALSAGQVRHASTIYTNWAAHRARFEGLTQALETSDKGLALCRTRGITSRVNYMLRNHVACLFRLGELDEVLETARASARSSRSAGHMHDLAQWQAWEVHVLLLRGQADELAPVLDDSEAGIADAIHGRERADLIGNAARIREALGHREAAIELVTLAADEELGFRGAVETALALRELALAERLSPLWAPGWFVSEWRLHDGTIIAEARGELETAVVGYSQLVDRFGDMDAVVDEAEMLVGLGRVQMRLGRTAEAADALNRARPILQKLRAAPLLAETDALLEQLTARSA
jgi:tetratricopeptide (TPR) repeat protein